MTPLVPYTKILSGRQYMGPIWTSTQPNSNPDSRILELPGRLSGYKNPDWKSKMRNKEDATTPLSIVQDFVKIVRPNGVYRHKVKPGFGYSVVTYESLGLWWQLYTNPASELPNSLDPNWDAVKQARNIALTYYNKYVSEKLRPVSSQVFLGEIKETLEFLRHPFAKLSNLANSAKMARYNAHARNSSQLIQRYRSGVDKIPPSEVNQVLEDIADAWFEIQFALKPLISDVEAAMQLAVLGQSRKSRSSFGGKASGNVTVPYNQVVQLAPELIGRKTVRQWIDAQYYIHCGINFEDGTNYDGFGSYLESSSKQLVEWIPTIYELVPGSWFADYFVNIGRILESVANNSYVSFNYNSHTTIAEVKRRYEFTRTANYPRYIQVLEEPGRPGYIERSRRFLNRTSSNDMNLSVRFSLPFKPVSLVNSAFYLSRKFSNLFR